MIPHDGQGTRLPKDFPLRGEWLIENHVFLYEPDGNELAAGTAPRFTRGWIAEDGNWRLGFDAGQIAAMFEISIDALLEANRTGQLKLRGTADLLPSDAQLSPHFFGGQNATGSWCFDATSLV
jgi:hypothetical protein